MWLDGQCDYKYLIHTAGFSYSGGPGSAAEGCGAGVQLGMYHQGRCGMHGVPRPQPHLLPCLADK